MKLFLTIAGAAALVHAQADSTGYFPGEPSCALPCLSSAITAAGCALSDIGCQCGPTQSVIANKVGGCILSSCTDPTELGAAINAGQAVCSSFLAGELSFTTPSGPAPTPTPTGSGSSSGSESGSTSGTSGPVTSPPTSTASSTAVSESGSESGSGDSTSESDHATHTDTLIGSESPILTGSLTSLPANPTGAAAAPASIGAGVLAGILGILAFL
ncbi:hypothetical protein F5B22DRAFT_464608 [Xylaria bambusicola]|uniref:uncharacterized protein n=1 Tax=Xylaria bambusicola TaxID=326684 RepID=UPI002007B1BE|nr:uncharacterized protein F5B22DRAFT_464608 [Xylaria bambusicola]KAI0522213.1 hypothetical protein F5B22DRAFT_464608 [Xylaria bambusicola]